MLAENDVEKQIEALSSSSSKARLAMIELSNMVSVPMSLNAIVRLKVPDAMYQSGKNTPLTPSEILSLIKPPPPPTSDPCNLQRLLRLLTAHNVFNETIDDSYTRRYSLTDVGLTLVSSSPESPSFAAYVLQHHQDALYNAWTMLHEAVLDPSVEPFKKAHRGMSAYEYYGKDEEANQLMQKAMWGVSEPFMEALIGGYDGGFDGVETLVDVGGSSGICLNMIMNKFHTIKKGINFDLPEVVAAASAAHVFPGITNVGGDMFECIPSGDAIFMKWVLTTWTDEECLTIMNNCYRALPGGGKVIACEPVLPEVSDDSRRSRALLEGDVFVMATYQAKGRERTELEFKKMGISCGFLNFRAIYLDHFYTVMEFQK